MTALGLRAENLTASYEDRLVLQELSLVVPPGKISVIVGANASGKSTLLRAMSRLLVPRNGQVLLDGKSIHHIPPRQLAQRLGLLPQSPITPEGITVADLVSRGRHPHQGLFGRWTREDDAAVEHALAATGITELASRDVDELSGGQRQRVWIAMVLAQETEVLLLDEPTTFLDVRHQVEVLDLLVDLNRSRGTTIVLVLHDLNLAARYGDCLAAVADGAIHAFGEPAAVLSEAMIERVFGVQCRVITDPVSGRPMMLPVGRHRILDDAPAPCRAGDFSS